MEISRFDFKVKYCVDIGELCFVEVSVFDFYKFDWLNVEILNVEFVLLDFCEVLIFIGDFKELECWVVSWNECFEKVK